eukprot:2223791-Rhodomonas_salina.1
MRGPRRSREDATPSVNAGKKNIWTAFNFVLWDPDNTRTHASDEFAGGSGFIKSEEKHIPHDT